VKETELFPPVKIMLEALDYDVYAEAKNCDVVGRKNDALVVVELKNNLNISLVSQGVQRQQLAQSVFLGIPEPKKKNRSFRVKQEILKRLGLGLITVYQSPVRLAAQIIIQPTFEGAINERKRQELLEELEKRSVDPNIGGSTNVPIYTAYREAAIMIANVFAAAGPTNLRDIRAFSGEKADSILARNVYGWFERVERGRYTISEKGLKELEDYDKINSLVRDKPEFKKFCDHLNTKTVISS